VSHSGTYVCRVEDVHGCIAGDSVHIVFEKLPYSNLPKEISGCNLVKLVLDESQFHYAWDDGFLLKEREFSQSGLYRLTITGGHCRVQDSVSVTVFPLPRFELEEDKFICRDEGIFLSPSAIQSDLIYRWSNGIEMPTIRVQEEGWYSLTATDRNGCSFKDSIRIGILPKPLISLKDEYWLCRSDSILLDAGDKMRKYEWRENDSLLSDTRYFWVSRAMILQLKIYSKDGCQADKKIEIHEAENPVYASFLAASEAFTGDSIVFVNLSYPEPFSSFWNFNDGMESTLSDPVHAYYISNRYAPVLNVNNTYCDDYEMKKIVIKPRLKSLQSEEKLQASGSQQIKAFSIYPNPAADFFRIRYEFTRAIEWNLRICNIQGITVFNKEIPGSEEGELWISTQRFAPGLYIIVMQTSNERKTLRLMVIR